MERPEPKSWLRAPELRARLVHGVAELLARARAGALPAALPALVERLGGDAQRIGHDAWRRIRERWPALADLASERLGPLAQALSTRAPLDSRPSPARQQAHAPSPARPQPHAPSPARPQAHAPSPAQSAARVDALVAQLSSAPSWQARASAASQLSGVETPAALAALIEALRDHSVEVALAVIDALSNRAEHAAMTALLGVLDNPDGYFNPVTRVAAVTALARRLEGAALAPLLRAVGDRDAEVSIAALAAVAEHARASLLDVALPVLRDAGGYYLPIVRLAAANALERSSHLSAALARELLQAEHDPAVRGVLERAEARQPAGAPS